MKKLFLILFFVVSIVSTKNVFAQVTIGSTKLPNQWSLLYLDASEKLGGLQLPRFTDEARNELRDKILAYLAEIDEAEKHNPIGLMIYNLGTNCVEFWSGSDWVSLCDNTE